MQNDIGGVACMATESRWKLFGKDWLSATRRAGK